jgi:DNA-binding LacI/PurR family transcriptional regulator
MARVLLEQIEGRKAGRDERSSRVLPTELVRRSSS